MLTSDNLQTYQSLVGQWLPLVLPADRYPPSRIARWVAEDQPFWPDKVNIFHAAYLRRLARQQRDLMEMVAMDLLLVAVVTARPDLGAILTAKDGRQWFERRVYSPMREEFVGNGNLA